MAANGGGYLIFTLIALCACIGLLVGTIVVASDSSSSATVSQQGPALLSGSIMCPAGSDRHLAAYTLRTTAAAIQYGRGAPCHVNNGDEARYAGQRYFSQYSKGLQHNATTGEVLPSAYIAFQGALVSQSAASIGAIPLAAGYERKLDNPQGGLAFELIGNDPQALTQGPAPRFDSAEMGSELMELYWMAYLRDVPFDQYGGNGDAIAAASELGTSTGALFRGTAPGCNVGPYISQFLWQDCPYGANAVDQHIQPSAQGVDYMVE